MKNLQEKGSRIDQALVLLRIASGLAFFYHGSGIAFGLFTGPGPARFAAAHHWPVVFGFLIGLTQVAAAVAILSGLLFRLGAMAICIVMSGAIFLVHFRYGFDVNNGGIEYALTQLLIAIAFLITGPGAYSLSTYFPSIRTRDVQLQRSPARIGLGDPGLESRTEKPLMQIVWKRRSTSAFSAEQVCEQDLRRILEAGLQAPSSYNLQPWRFVAVRDFEQRQRLSLAALNQAQVKQAPVVIVACGDTQGWREDLEEMVRIGREHGFNDEQRIAKKRKMVMEDLTSQPNMAMWVTKQTMIAATTMMWVAEALGYDTGPMEGFNENDVRNVLDIPQHVRVLFLLAIGRLEGEDSKHPGRLLPSRTVFSERYGRPFEGLISGPQS
jgi:nitroreductase/uncharacterized membrane protein YphA (DoxX/SURF4 family)